MIMDSLKVYALLCEVMVINLDLKLVMMATPMKMTGDLVIVAPSILDIPAQLELVPHLNQFVHQSEVMDTTWIVMKTEMMET